ncbi:response regulator [Undibacterium terreum]|uniref:Two-component system response regulator n=1 Tax=Undibacterium terreum TaxID=1224302 RepID=A0A916XEW6_9BURK|nr:HD domain-containing phosphohydrolase [Undibacterium terreum]GGC65483.1 two-component system response regulator [Undibacterium terreum]
MKKQTVLLVDDEASTLALLRTILDQEYRLVFARNGAEAVAAVLKHRPSLALLDVGLPDVNGYDLCQHIKQIDPTQALQVIFITAYASLEQETKGFAAGAVDYIVKPVSAPIVRARVAAHLSLVRVTALERSHRDAILMLAHAGHYNDTDTGAHIWRMGAYAAALARACGWDAESVARMELAAPMHDTGKLGIPQAILRKPGPLDEQEWEVMRTHAQIGHDILRKSKAPLFQLAAEVALRHHEKWDGSGYPGGMKAKEIPESARIVALADVFDALSMKRPYKEPWATDRILSYLKENAGSHFDPEMVPVFCGIVPELLEIRTRSHDATATSAEL